MSSVTVAVRNGVWVLHRHTNHKGIFEPGHIRFPTAQGLAKNHVGKCQNINASAVYG